MIQKVKRILDLISNMGIRYIVFRILYMIKGKTGYTKYRFPTQPIYKEYYTLQEWRNNLPNFFFYGKNIANLPRKKSKELEKRYQDIKKGKYVFFNRATYHIGTTFDWITNPTTNYQYHIDKHWSEINDFSEEAGDIKYVWEKARFSFLYDIIRYDYHFDSDQSAFVFDEILDFIEKNPINQGPNYKCSQEISLRTLNWTFALYYYKDSEHLTEDLFAKILHAIYWQIHHVFHNINFSRIAVRNNHAITETLMLYLSEKLFPFLPNVRHWSRKGKQWFEQEIKYQVYEDGTFLQFSMNYHRVVVQLLTWGIVLSELNNDKFSEVVYDRAKKSLDFLDACSDPVTGMLPNYGANDGALFFKLTDDDYRNYRSQLDDLRAALSNETYFKSESQQWYGLSPEKVAPSYTQGISTFDVGGYYVLQEQNTKTFIRCGSYKDRPAQSDNLHVDIWVDGKNILRDSGSYKYNTERKYIEYFNGTEGHNSVCIDNHSQMLKGSRFIWHYWIKKSAATLQKVKSNFIFDGQILAFRQIRKNITHSRKLTKAEQENKWFIEDHINNLKGEQVSQFWHFPLEVEKDLLFQAQDANGKVIQPVVEDRYFSGYYGVKEKSRRLVFKTSTNRIFTEISYKK